MTHDHPACVGTNCCRTSYDQPHSPGCVAEHAAAVASESGPWAVVANVVSDRALRTGARVWILMVNGDAEHPKVFGLNKNGHAIEKYTAFKRLTNFRAGWVPPSMRALCSVTYATKEEAAAYALALTGMWSDVRFFDRSGAAILREGVSTGEAFKRLSAASSAKGGE